MQYSEHQPTNYHLSFQPTDEEYASGSQTLINQFQLKDNRRIQIFRTIKRDDLLSNKIIQKAIIWLQSTGYTKQLNFETIILSISLFYASLNYLTINKHCLQSTLCACLLLSGKMTHQDTINMSELLFSIDNRQTSQSIILQQSKILQFLDFNLYFNFPLLQFLNSSSIDQSHQQILKFLTELFLIKQPTILYQIQSIKQLLHLVLDPIEEKTVIKIKKMMKNKNYQHLIHKYNSKFDVEHLFEQRNVITSIL